MKFVLWSIVYGIITVLIGYYSGVSETKHFYENNPEACLSVCVEEFSKMGC